MYAYACSLFLNRKAFLSVELEFDHRHGCTYLGLPQAHSIITYGY